jgi:hypothetical protein
VPTNQNDDNIIEFNEERKRKDYRREKKIDD